ncbi:hypothetical protein O9H85_26135 [Paenibacillus filicis]|uniref:Uncharacterized protein n=1 Tax=Paenibacillus gyeongsangnamensis TaxID=3388067 RepID=A0ABT4QG33_9BACL|nr:hypothetical protein [Paenibacillus filicis]MCZ8515828.1 hypothetical protein [Paenibacillus filicis]
MLEIVDPLPVLKDIRLLNGKIGSMEVFRFDCELIKIRIPGNSCDCNCGLLKISSKGVYGWGEYILPYNTKSFDLVQWASVFTNLKGLSIPEAFQYIQSKDAAWGNIRRELAESALTDLASKLISPQKHKELTVERSYLMEHSQSYFSF